MWFLLESLFKWHKQYFVPYLSQYTGQLEKWALADISENSRTTKIMYRTGISDAWELGWGGDGGGKPDCKEAQGNFFKLFILIRV